ncbi:hypothetical protein AXK11_05215 [Cephaloticoccus primus]|uniref:PIN domain-containing protein n=1 Tax=Cephaloticoccus primus TaxID=1548207 RepID=A0A139SMU1_9BACT|nr:hypothetical protein AXK11_05215 [Cephaloticoccus primus]
MLACAIEGRARTIVTFNLRDFRAADLEKWQVRAVHPQDYLLELYAIDVPGVMRSLTAAAQGRAVPLTVPEFLRRLGRSLPKFSEKLLSEAG